MTAVPYHAETDVSIFQRSEFPRDVFNGEAFIELSAEAFRAQTLLVHASWWQVPAASIPASEASQAALAGFGRDLESWRAVAAECLAVGWTECEDGRLYFLPLAHAVEEAFDRRKITSKGAAIRQRRRRLMVALEDLGVDGKTVKAGVLDQIWAALKDRGGEGMRGERRLSAIRMIASDLGLLPTFEPSDGVADLRLATEFRQMKGV